MVKTRADFYRLTVEDLESLERFARKSAENLYASIQRSRTGRSARVLNGLGIPQVGETTAIDLARWVARHVPPEPRAGWLTRIGAFLRDVARDEPDRFAEVEGVGPTVSQSLAAWFADEPRRASWTSSPRSGVEPEPPGAGRGGRGRPVGGPDGRRHGLARGVQPRVGGGGDPRRGRQARGLGVEEDRLPRGRAGRGLEARQGHRAGVAVLDEDGFRRLLEGANPTPDEGA